MTTGIFMVNLIHPSVSTAMFELYNCNAIRNDGELTENPKWMDTDYSVQCFAGQYWLFAGISLFMIFLYVFGWPYSVLQVSSLACSLARHMARNSLANKTIQPKRRTYRRLGATRLLTRSSPSACSVCCTITTWSWCTRKSFSTKMAPRRTTRSLACASLGACPS